MTPHEFHGNARAAVVNRTHRVVRNEALMLRAQRERSRGLWVPLAICSALLLVVLYAVWTMLSFYDITPNGIPDAGDQLPLMMLWFLPITAVALGVVWFRRARANEGEAPR
jgi:polyferredoxin